MSFPPPPAVAGTSLDGREPFVIDPEENRRLCATVEVEPDPSGKAHPIYSFIATQAGMGMTVKGLCDVCEFDIEQGPMLGSTRVDFSRPLMTGRPYRVQGTIVGVTRKASRKLGVMDVLEYRLVLREDGGEHVLEITNTWILPRRELA